MIDFEEVIKFIKNKNNIKLFEYQKEIVKAMLLGKTVYTPRCAGRTVLYNGYADYLKNIESNKQYYNDADIYINYVDVVNSKIMREDSAERCKSILEEERFKREFIGHD